MTETPQTYEEARAELVEVVGRLEAGATGLEESMTLWERGEELAATCQRYLDDARTRLDTALGTNAADDEAAQPAEG